MISISAQVSLYPLGQESLSPAIDEALRIFQKHGLDVKPGAMSSVIIGDDAAIFAALQEAFRCVAKEGQVVMVEQYKHGPGHWMLDLPAGYLEPDDPSPLETARRELLEETGFASNDWHPLGEFTVNPNRSTDKACFFLALGARRIQGQHLDEAEDILVRLVPLEEVTGLVLEGRVESLSTVCALLLGLEALRQRGYEGTSQVTL